MFLLFLMQILGDEISSRTLARDAQHNIENGIGCRNLDGLLRICNNMDVNGAKNLFKSQKFGTNASLGQRIGEGAMLPIEEVGTCAPNFNQQSVGPILFKPDSSRQNQAFKDTTETLAQPSLNFCLTNALSPLGSVLPFPDGIVEGSEQNRVSPSQQGQRAHQILPKPPEPGCSAGSAATKRMASQIRIARPPAEGRGRSQLLPRYWPRITDQELHQICGEYPFFYISFFHCYLSLKSISITMD